MSSQATRRDDVEEPRTFYLRVDIPTDPIFNAFATAEIVWAEVSRLVAALREGFLPELDLGPPIEAGMEEDWASSRAGYHFKVAKAVPRQRLPSQLLFVFDMARPEMPSSWAQARSALLTCAYAPKYDEGWDVEEVAVGMDGRPISAESRANCTVHADGRLLEWGRSSLAWRQRDWLFSVPLLAVDGIEALRREVLDPIRGLLMSDRPVKEIFGERSAIRFLT